MCLNNAIAVIIGDKTVGRLCTKLVEFLQNQPEGSTFVNRTTRPDYERMVNIINNRRCDYGTVAQMIVAITAFNPGYADHAIQAISAPLTSAHRFSPPPSYTMGAVLGIFQAGLWLDKEWWPNEQSFDKALPAVLASFMFSPHLSQTALEFALEFAEGQQKLDSLYAHRLDKTIKDYVRFDVNGVRPKRNMTMWNVFERLELAGAGITDMTMPILGKAVADSLFFADIGAISTMGRVHAHCAYSQSQRAMFATASS